MDIFTALFSGDKVCPCESKPEQQDEQRDELGRRSHRYCHRVSSLSFSQVMIVSKDYNQAQDSTVTKR